MTVHFENNNAFLVVTRLERVLELSMWGNIAIEETIDVRHNGAKLKGAFSRYEFQRENSGVSSVKSFKTVLPASGSLTYVLNYQILLQNLSHKNVIFLQVLKA
jgi:oligosaccharyltransferase complex subunit alpha (ribophorin I)